MIAFVVFLEVLLNTLLKRKGFPIITLAYILAVIIPSISVTVRRLHDTGHAGWWYLGACIPYIGIIFYLTVLVFCCKASDPSTNKYGPSPLDGANNQVQAVSNKDQAGQLFHEAHKYSSEGPENNLDKALELLTQAMQLYPDSVSILVARAKVLCKQENFTAGLEDLNSVIKIQPNVANHYQFRAKIFEHLNQQAEAAADLEKYNNLSQAKE